MSGAATAIGIGTAIGGIGSLASGAIGANAAGNAASTQAAAANHAADLQAQASANALDFQKQQYNTSQQQQAPWLAAGNNGLNALQYGLGTGGTANGTGVGQGSLSTPYGKSFTAPTGLDEQNDPGYQARLQLGTDAIQKSAAARGSVVTGGTAKALDTYGQDYASNEYGNVYNRALNTFNSNENTYNTNQTNQYNKLAALAGTGQQTATNLATEGQAASNNVTSNLLGTAAAQGQDYTNAGNATASGYINSANAYGGGLQGATGILNQGISQNNQLNQFSQLQQLLNARSSSGYGTSSPYTNGLGDHVG
jgi:hypothetical protein